MKEQRISIEIDGEGRLSAEAEGFTGNACIKDLEKLLEGLAVAWEHVEEKRDGKTSQLTQRQHRKISAGRKG